MKWYKRDPDAAIAGMIGLTLEERGAYNTLLDLLYSRDGNVPNDDRFMCRALECRPQMWRRIKASLIAKGKVRETGSKLSANRVESELKEAQNRLDWSRFANEKRWKNNVPGFPTQDSKPQPQPYNKISYYSNKEGRKTDFWCDEAVADRRWKRERSQ